MYAKSKWDSLIFGTYNIKQIQDAVNDATWQRFRVSLLGLPNDEKFERLRLWMNLHPATTKAKVQVTNYVNALKRGGLI